MNDVVLRASDLEKTFRKPFTGRLVRAVSGVSLDVRRGEIFGFLGPNGAGKTTTIKMLTGLIAPTRGTMEILARALPCPDVMARVGFLSENPYIYPYLTPREFVTLCGRLSGLSTASLKSRTVQVIERVGVPDAIDRPARTLSKGMLQRVALAAALVHRADERTRSRRAQGGPRPDCGGERTRQHGLLLESYSERRRDALRSRLHPAQRKSRGRGEPA